MKIIVQALQSNPQTKLTTLNLQTTSLGESEITELVQFLDSLNCRITSLDLSKNQITEQGAQEILNVVKTNKNIVQINLTENTGISSATLARINEALEFNKQQAQKMQRQQSAAQASSSTATTAELVSTSTAAIIAAAAAARSESQPRPKQY